jgi:hypothetical protein
LPALHRDDGRTELIVHDIHPAMGAFGLPEIDARRLLAA